MELPKNRTMHLVDIENVCGNARPLRHDVEMARRCYEELMSPGADDHFVIACNHGACIEVGLAWLGARLVVRSGPDGADLALLGILDHEDIPSRFGRVVIASGDGIFADVADQLASEGVEVTVVSLEHSLSRRLRLAAGRVRLIPRPHRDAA
jgi:hypothetical protein